MKTHTFDTYTPDGTAYSLHYKIWGEDNPADKTLVCVHGLTGNSGDFKYLGEHLSANDTYRVVAIDMPGRGESAYFDNAEDYNFAQYLADIDRLLEQIGCTAPASCDWLGVSMGGLLGFYVAARKSSPIRNLILNDVGIEVPQEDLNFIAQYITVTNVYNRPEDLVPLLKMALGGPYSRGPMDEDRWLLFAKTYLRQTADGKYSRNMDDKIAVMFQKEPLGSINLENLWADVKQPVLALRGALSTLFPMMIAEKMMQTKTGEKMELEIIPDCGHVPSLFRPDQINLVTNWLKAR